MSKHYTISLTPEVGQALESMRESDKEFNFSLFVQEAILSDTVRLNESEALRKIKESEIIIELEQEKISKLTEMLPTIKANDNITQSENIHNMQNAVDILQRKIKKGVNELEIIKIARVWEKLTKINYKELIKEAQCRVD